MLATPILALLVLLHQSDALHSAFASATRLRSTVSMNSMQSKIAGSILSVCLVLGGPAGSLLAHAADIPKVPLLTKKTSSTQAYSDVGRGFKLLRPFGFNEFDGAGGGYAVKFASLFDVDENVVVGSTPAVPGKDSITDYGSSEDIGAKLAKKRGGQLVSAEVRDTDGIIFYQFQFENPLDMSLPRTGPKNNRPTKQIELYELCVNRGRLWSVQASSNDKAFPSHEQVFRDTLASFIPRL